jgi:CPA2 family monovalent cation:H+ antiporter-2
MPELQHQNDHAIIAGFGVPGRLVAEILESRGMPYTVIDTNASTCTRAEKSGRRLINGDASAIQVLREAGIETATLLVIAIPDQKAALKATREARAANPNIRIVTRTQFTSAGMEARQLGADEVVVAEQAVANEFARLLSHQDPASTTASPCSAPKVPSAH